MKRKIKTPALVIFGLLMVAIVLALVGRRSSGELLATSGAVGSDVKQGEPADAKACEA